MVNYTALALVGLGGALGSGLRYIIGVITADIFPETRYPLGTIIVNIAGCLLIGLIVELFTSRNDLAPEWRLFVITGFLGGFTTFSAFGLETVTLLRSGAAGSALISVALQVVVGCLAVFLGGTLARALR